MTFEIAFTLSAVAVLFILFVRQSSATELLALAVVCVLMVAGILSMRDVLGVFSNPAAMTIAAMFVLSAALDKTGVIDSIGKAAIRLGERSALLAISVIFGAVFIASFFINNTSVVIIMIPVMIMLAKKLQLSASKLLIPLSYIAILGGTCTLIGTSTNLLVDGIAQDMGLAPFGMFEIFVPGMAFALVGGLYMILIGHRFLPNHQSLSDFFDTKIKRQYLSQVALTQKSPMIGKKIEDTYLARDNEIEIVQHIPATAPGDHLFNLLNLINTADIFRRKIQPSDNDSSSDKVDMQAVLQEGDRLVLMSSQRNTLTLDKKTEETDSPDKITSDPAIVMEGAIAPRSNLMGMLIDDFNTDDLYRAQIIAVHRQNGKIISDFNTVKLSVGDTVLIKGVEAELARIFENGELINLSKPELEPFHKKHAPIAIAALLAVIGLASFNIMPIAACAFIAAIVVIMTGCIKAQDAYKSLQGSVLLMIYGMLAISVAMDKSGALHYVIDGLLDVVEGLPPIVVLSLFYFLTSAITEMFSNNAAAVMLTPIAIGLAESMGVDPRPFAAAIMFGASASFATPIGYQTNTLVFHAGGYQFKDFLRIGTPMNLLMWAVATIVIPLYWEL
ncbi:MAG: SLC13 family permease [Micavibrio sp.]